MNQETLSNIANEINSQDNRITSDPLFCVFEKIRIFGMDSDYASDFEWFDPNDTECGWEQNEFTDEQGEAKGLKKCYYVETDRFVNAHFTEKAANHFIEINRHNLTRPFTYVTSLWRCNEMIDIRNALKDGKLKAV